MKKSINLMLSLIVMTAFMALASCSSDNNSGAGGGGGGNSYPFVGTWVSESSSATGTAANTIGYKKKQTVTYSSDGKYQKKEESTNTFSTIAYAQAYYQSKIASMKEDDDEYYTISGASVTKVEIQEGSFTYDEKTGFVTLSVYDVNPRTGKKIAGSEDTKRKVLDVKDGVLTSTSVTSNGSVGTPETFTSTTPTPNNQSSSNNSSNNSQNNSQNNSGSNVGGSGIVGAWGWSYNGVLGEAWVFCPDGMTMYIVEYKNGQIHDIEEMRYTYNPSTGILTIQEDSTEKPFAHTVSLSGGSLSWVDSDGDQVVLQRMANLPMSYDDLKKNCKDPYK